MTNPHASIIRHEAKEIVQAASQSCGVSHRKMMSASRAAELVEARFVAMLVLRRAGWSYPNIAIAVGRDDHTTCIHGVKAAQAKERDDPGFRAAIAYTQRKVKSDVSDH